MRHAILPFPNRGYQTVIPDGVFALSEAIAPWRLEIGSSDGSVEHNAPSLRLSPLDL